MAVSQLWNSLVSKCLFKELKGRYGRIKVITDGVVPWYPWACRTRELEQEVMGEE